MDIYKINISSSGNGWKDSKSVRGEVREENGGVIFRYSLDGDECILTVNGKKALQQRKGEQCVTIHFEEGRRTECAIGSGNFCGSFGVFTKSLKFISGKGGYKLSLEYLSGADEELINLTLTAVKILN